MFFVHMSFAFPLTPCFLFFPLYPSLVPPSPSSQLLPSLISNTSPSKVSLPPHPHVTFFLIALSLLCNLICSFLPFLLLHHLSFFLSSPLLFISLSSSILCLPLSLYVPFPPHSLLSFFHASYFFLILYIASPCLIFPISLLHFLLALSFPSSSHFHQPSPFTSSPHHLSIFRLAGEHRGRSLLGVSQADNEPCRTGMPRRLCSTCPAEAALLTG